MFHVEHYGDFVVQVLSCQASRVGIQLTSEQLDACRRYASELIAWNQKINLTTITEASEVAIKHFLDSLYGVRVLSRDTRDMAILDIGTGAGFPGIPLKIVRPDVELYLLEKNAKKCSFLANVSGKLRLQKTLIINKGLEWALVEDAWQHKFSHIVARAINIDNVLPEITTLLRKGGKFILYRTSSIEVDQLPPELIAVEEIEYVLPMGMGLRRLVILERSSQLADRDESSGNVPRGTLMEPI